MVNWTALFWVHHVFISTTYICRNWEPPCLAKADLRRSYSEKQCPLPSAYLPVCMMKDVCSGFVGGLCLGTARSLRATAGCMVPAARSDWHWHPCNPREAWTRKAIWLKITSPAQGYCPAGDVACASSPPSSTDSREGTGGGKGDRNRVRAVTGAAGGMPGAVASGQSLNLCILISASIKWDQ